MITPSLRPQHYVGGRTVSWTFAPEVVEVATSVNALPPAISKYIAYDNLTPPNPFIAVTEDGAGRVLYDGSFTKFYNSNGPSSSSDTFDDLNGSFKYLYNAINWAADPNKPKRILVLGNSAVNESYAVKGTGGNDFRTSLERIAAITGYEITIKDHTDYGGMLDVDLAELQQYAVLFLMGVRYRGESFYSISESAVQDIVTYRRGGGGILLITDHGDDIRSIEEAQQPHEGFIAMVNRVAVHFGAYFTRDYDRTSISVGFLRENYGDHPLYNGLLDSDLIYGQTSESEVVVTEIETLEPNTVPDTVMSTPGSYTINFLMVLTDGSLETRRFTYTIIEGEFVYFTPPNGDPLLGYQHQSPTRTFWLDLIVTEDDMGTLVGLLLRNDVPVGRFYHSTGEGTQYQWFSGDQNGVPVAGGDIFGIEIQQPFGYYMEVSTDLVDPTIPELQVDLAKTLNGVGDLSVSGGDGRGLLREYQTLIRERLLPKSRQVVNYAESLKALLKHLTNADPEYPTLEFDIYPDTPSVESALPGLPSDTPSVIAADTGTVWTRHTGEWSIVPQLTPYHYLGRRELISKESGVRYRVTPEGVVQI